jgi:ABC-type Fe3+ transport system substrate-binding protein
MTRKSSGETFAQVKAEATNPKGDVWWGGTGDPHLQAAEEDLTEAYESPMRELHPWAISQAEAPATRPSASIPARWASATTRTAGRTTCPSRPAGPT